MLQLYEEEAVRFLRGYGSVRDGALKSLLFYGLADDPSVELIFEVGRASSVQIVHILLTHVLSAQYCFEADDRHWQLEEFKCLKSQDGVVYISLDPYNEREDHPSDHDNHVFRAKSIALKVSEKT
jgi:hypothetical protein